MIRSLYPVTTGSKRELKQRHFWAAHVNRKWTSSTLKLWFWINVLNRLYKSKDTFDGVKAQEGGGGGEYTREFWIGVCREGSGTPPLFKE